MDEVGLLPWLIETNVINERTAGKGMIASKNLNSFKGIRFMNPFARINRLRKKFSGVPSGKHRKRYAQNHEYDFFGDSVDVVVTIDSDTIHAPKRVARLVLLFADPQVGAVTEDIIKV